MKPARFPTTVPFECSCGTIHNTQDGKLPVGWTTRHGLTWCDDCTLAGVPVRQLQHGGSRRRRAA